MKAKRGCFGCHLMKEGSIRHWQGPRDATETQVRGKDASELMGQRPRGPRRFWSRGEACWSLLEQISESLLLKDPVQVQI